MTAAAHDFSRVFTVNGEIVTRTIAGEVFLVPIRGQLADMRCLFSLNPVAEYIWKRLDGRNSLEDIRGHVASAFEVGHQEAAADIGEFVEELLAAGLVKEGGR